VVNIKRGFDMILKGKCWKFGDNVDTDVIIPARYLNVSDPNELAKHVMEDIDKEFVKKASKGDIIISGNNFGCGSSREHAPLSIKTFGISCVIAKSFARIFFRNAINIGLPIIESSEVVNDAEEGNEIEVITDKGIIKNISKQKEYTIPAFPEFLQELIENGGLMNWIRKFKLNI
jgi:3-isopropylmalate/(R)-2-methylmalate dehydratase small subunit